MGLGGPIFTSELNYQKWPYFEDFAPSEQVELMENLLRSTWARAFDGKNKLTSEKALKIPRGKNKQTNNPHRRLILPVASVKS